MCSHTVHKASPSTRKITALVASHKPSGTSRHRIQHRLNVRRRAGNHAQNLARRRLLLRALANFLRLRGNRLL